MTLISPQPAAGPLSLAACDWRLRAEPPNEWAWFKRSAQQHDLAQWRPVAIRAAIQQALQVTGLLPELYRDLNTLAAEWTEHRDWIYGLDVDLAPAFADQRAFLEFDSVDDVCHVYVSGVLAGAHEAPGAPFDLEIGPLLRPGRNQLLVLIDAVRREDPQIGSTAATRSLKGRVGYSMDFAPRLVKTGILGDVRLRFSGPTRLRDLWARSQLHAGTARVQLSVRVDGPAPEIRFAVLQEHTQIASAVAAPGPDGIAHCEIPPSKRTVKLEHCIDKIPGSDLHEDQSLVLVTCAAAGGAAPQAGALGMAIAAMLRAAGFTVFTPIRSR